MATLLYVRIPRYRVRLGLPLDRLLEFNPHHDQLGRFASAGGAPALAPDLGGGYGGGADSGEQTLDGEFWLDGTSSLFADGDIGDMNHEGFAIEAARSAVANKLGVDGENSSGTLDLTARAMDANEGDQELRKMVLAYWDGKSHAGNMIRDRFKIDHETWDVADGGGDPRFWAQKELGWVRMAGNSLQMVGIDGAKMSDVGQAIGDAHPDREDLERQTFDLEVVTRDSVGKDRTVRSRTYYNVPLSVLDSGDISQLRKYGTDFQESLDKILRQLAALQEAYNPNQPRHPKGTKEGGRFVKSGVSARKSLVVKPNGLEHTSVGEKLKSEAAKAIAARIPRSPELDTQFAGLAEYIGDTYADPAFTPANPHEAVCHAFQAAWAGSSSGSVLSNALQNRARSIFGLKSAHQSPKDPAAERRAVDEKVDELMSSDALDIEPILQGWRAWKKTHKTGRLDLQAYAAKALRPTAQKLLAAEREEYELKPYHQAIDAYLQTVYAQTQDELRKKGISKVTVYRGMTMGGFPPDELPNIVPQSPGDAIHSRPTVRRQRVTTNPLSSYTADIKYAAHFAESGLGSREGAPEGRGDTQRAVVVQETLPASMILSTYLSGLGCRKESEVIVLGGTRTARVATYASRPWILPFSAMPAMSEKVLSQALQESSELPILDLDASPELEDWLIGLPDHLQEAYNPNQPRIPAGSAEGGRFAKSGAAPSIKVTTEGKGKIPDEFTGRVRAVLAKLPPSVTELIADVTVAINSDPSHGVAGRYRPYLPPTAVIYHEHLTKTTSDYEGETYPETTLLHEIGHATSHALEVKAKRAPRNGAVQASDRQDFQELIRDVNLMRLEAASRGETVEGRFSPENLRVHRVAPIDLSYIHHYWSGEEIWAQAFALAVAHRENIPVTAPSCYIFEKLFGDVISHVEGIVYED